MTTRASLQESIGKLLVLMTYLAEKLFLPQFFYVSYLLISVTKLSEMIIRLCMWKGDMRNAKEQD